MIKGKCFFVVVVVVVFGTTNWGNEQGIQIKQEIT